MGNDIYFKEVVKPLRKLEELGKGEVFNVSKNVYGFKTNKSPDILVTGCHHASEIFGTYEAIIELLKTNNTNIAAVPVVDVENFKHYKKHSDHFLKEYNGTSMEVCFVSDFIKGYKGNKPKRMEWQYGKTKTQEPIDELSKIIDDSKLVLDVHNSFLDKHLLITNLLDKPKENKFMYEVLKYLENKESLYEGHLNNKYKKIFKGLFESNIENTVLSYASSKDITNLVFEIPVYDGKKIYDFNMLKNQTCKLLEYTIKQFNKYKR
jgi:hypothetical protein